MMRQQKRTRTKRDRELAMYAAMGMQHPKEAVKDSVLEFRLRHLRSFLGKQSADQNKRQA
jgi:hypothetical protein